MNKRETINFSFFRIDLCKLTAFMRMLDKDQLTTCCKALGITKGFRHIDFRPLTPKHIEMGKEIAAKYGLKVKP